MPNGKKHKRHKMSTHKRKKRLRKNRHKKHYSVILWHERRAHFLSAPLIYV